MSAWLFLVVLIKSFPKGVIKQAEIFLTLVASFKMFFLRLENISSIIYETVGDIHADVSLISEINRLINFISHFQTK